MVFTWSPAASCCFDYANSSLVVNEREIVNMSWLLPHTGLIPGSPTVPNRPVSESPLKRHEWLCNI